MMQPDRPKMTI